MLIYRISFGQCVYVTRFQNYEYTLSEIFITWDTWQIPNQANISILALANIPDLPCMVDGHANLPKRIAKDYGP